VEERRGILDREHETVIVEQNRGMGGMGMNQGYNQNMGGMGGYG
jgi:hypothetical protein